MIQSLLIAVAIAVVLAAIGAVLLAVLAAGERGPRRSRLRRPDSAVDTYIDKNASWAASVTVDSKSTPEAVFTLISDRPYLGRLPFITGPTNLDDGSRVTRSILAAYTEDVVERVARQSYITVGTGVSVPLIIETFAQRYRIEPTDGGSRVEWAIGVTPQWIGWFPLRWTAFIAKPAMKIVLTWALRGA